MGKRFEIESAPTNNDHCFSSGMDLTNRRFRGRSKFFHVHWLAQWNRAQQMVRRLCQRRFVRLRGQQIETAIDLKCIRTHDFCVKPVRHVGR